VQTTVEEAQRNAGEELERARAGGDRLVDQLAAEMLERTLGSAAR
jgi:hypothetical protein